MAAVTPQDSRVGDQERQLWKYTQELQELLMHFRLDKSAWPEIWLSRR